jgi:hypothetical protein
MIFDLSLISEFIVKSPESVAEPSYFTIKALEGLFPAKPLDPLISPLPITKATPGVVPVYWPSTKK